MNVLEKVRAEKGLTNGEMIERLGITKSYYSMIRRGLRPVSKDMAAKLNRVFGVPYEVSFCTEVHTADTETLKNRIA